MRRNPLIALAAIVLPLLAIGCGGGGSGASDDIVSSRSVPTATIPAQLPPPLIVGSEGFPAPTGAIVGLGGQATYIVKSGDTLSGIASEYKITIAELQQTNGMTNSSILRAGQTLLIPSTLSFGNTTTIVGPTSTPTGTATPRPGGGQVYMVKAGDTGAEIASEYGITLGQLAQANNMTIEQLSRIDVGQELIIP